MPDFKLAVFYSLGENFEGKGFLCGFHRERGLLGSYFQGLRATCSS